MSRAVTYTSEHAPHRRPGFNATGADEFLAGATTQSITVEFYGLVRERRGSPDDLPDPREPVDRRVRVAARQTSSISATNPALKGNVQVLTYNPRRLAARRRRSRSSSSADATGLAYFTT
jgi:hypothetical protein